MTSPSYARPLSQALKHAKGPASLLSRPHSSDLPQRSRTVCTLHSAPFQPIINAILLVNSGLASSTVSQQQQSRSSGSWRAHLLRSIRGHAKLLHVNPGLQPFSQPPISHFDPARQSILDGTRRDSTAARYNNKRAETLPSISSLTFHLSPSLSNFANRAHPLQNTVASRQPQLSPQPLQAQPEGINNRTANQDEELIATPGRTRKKCALVQATFSTIYDSPTTTDGMAHLESSPPDGLYNYSNERKPLMSITLPRNFAPMGYDGVGEPRTPDQSFSEPALPPPPHHSTVRVRRNRINMNEFQARNNALPPTLFASEIPVPSSVQAATRYTEQLELQATSFTPDTPLPSIELPQQNTATRPTLQYSFSEPPPSYGLRLPPFRDYLPTTPPAQTKAPDSGYKASVWEMERSSSVSSMRSDDSLGSADTFPSRPTSFGGSATSPEMDLRDPFSPQKLNFVSNTTSRNSKKVRHHAFTSKEYVKWSIEMDNHLFNVYNMYLGDPTVTPFKTVPGSIPPSGVCRRVARRARELWPKASKISRPIVKRYKLRNVFDERYNVRDKTPEPNDFLRVRDSPPTASSGEGRGSWPSDSTTRKRLRQLCKDKFTITAHYQRLRESRSPSPFSDAVPRRSTSRITRSMSRQMTAPDTMSSSTTSPATYATRELGISLVASGATAPLAQLFTGDSPPTQYQSDDFFNTPIGSSSQRGLSPTGLGIDSSGLAPPATGIPRLASPFKPFASSTWNGPTRSDRNHRREVSQNQFDTVHITGPRLLSPMRLEPDMSSNANKRRAQHVLEEELSPSGSVLGQKSSVQELIFTGAGDLSQRRIRMRNRGATLGSTANNKLDSLFTPPATNSIIAGPLDVPSLPPLPTSLAVPEPSDREKRLGSPFELDPNKRSNRSRTPRHIPSMSDPFISSNMFNAASNTSAETQPSIGERLAQFTAMHQDLLQQQQQDREGNPF